MNKRSAYVSLLVGLAAALGGTLATAQTGTAEQGLQTATSGPASSTTPAATSDSAASPPAKKSPQTVLAESRAALDRMEATSDNISRMLRAARDDKDVVKTLCLDDKLNQIDVAIRAASDRLAIIEAAVQGNSTERLDHDESVLAALSARGSELAVEANQCIGEEGGSMGAAELKVTFDPAIPEGAIAIIQPTPAFISEPPKAASPTTPE